MQRLLKLGMEVEISEADKIQLKFKKSWYISYGSIAFKDVEEDEADGDVEFVHPLEEQTIQDDSDIGSDQEGEFEDCNGNGLNEFSSYEDELDSPECLENQNATILPNHR